MVTRAALLLALLLGGPRMPGPGPQPGRGRIDRNAECARCHPDVAEEWAASLHRASAEDPEYRRAYRREPLRFCQKCHVPEGMAKGIGEEPAAEAVGVGCVTCHWAGAGAVLAAPGPVSAAARAAHRVVEARAFAAEGACAGCHEFEFPDAAFRERRALMQSTVEEHGRSWASGYACAECHMPWTEAGGVGHRSHRFEGSRDPEAVARALEVSARRTGAATVEITLALHGAGHAFPTGDLFRRVEVSVQLVGADRRYPPQIRHLDRRFEEGQELPGIVVRRESADTRVHEAPVVLRFDLASSDAGLCEEPGGLWAVYRVTYQRVGFPGRRGAAQIEGEVRIAEGALPGPES